MVHVCNWIAYRASRPTTKNGHEFRQFFSPFSLPIVIRSCLVGNGGMIVSLSFLPSLPPRHTCAHLQPMPPLHTRAACQQHRLRTSPWWTTHYRPRTAMTRPLASTMTRPQGCTMTLRHRYTLCGWILWRVFCACGCTVRV